MTTGVIFTTFHFHHNLLMDPISQNITLHQAGKDKCTSFLGQFENDEENEVLWIWLLWLYSQHIIFFITYEFAQ